jgi:hypothetical protein
VTRRQKSWSTCLESPDLGAIGIIANVEVGAERLNQRAATAVSPCSECVVQFCLAFQQCEASCVESQLEYVIWLSCLLSWSGTAGCCMNCVGTFTSPNDGSGDSDSDGTGGVGSSASNAESAATVWVESVRGDASTARIGVTVLILCFSWVATTVFYIVVRAQAVRVSCSRPFQHFRTKTKFCKCGTGLWNTCRNTLRKPVSHYDTDLSSAENIIFLQPIHPKQNHRVHLFFILLMQIADRRRAKNARSRHWRTSGFGTASSSLLTI